MTFSVACSILRFVICNNKTPTSYELHKARPQYLLHRHTGWFEIICRLSAFEITHNEINSKHPFCVLEKNGLRINLFQNEALAKEHNPEFRLVTDNIKDVYDEIASTHPQLLHPNLNKITLRPWGAKEFAIKDNQLGIVFQEW